MSVRVGASSEIAAKHRLAGKGLIEIASSRYRSYRKLWKPTGELIQSLDTNQVRLNQVCVSSDNRLVGVAAHTSEAKLQAL